MLSRDDSRLRSYSLDRVACVRSAGLPFVLALFGALGCAGVPAEEGEIPAELAQALMTEDGTDPTAWARASALALISQMTLEEKIAQLQHAAPAIERLGLPAYNYWSEALHGVLTNAATSFPTPVALGASWDPDLVQRVATAISDEARGIAVRDGKGLTYWSPVINMERDPRWGRSDETFTEDPYLMSRLGVAFVRGLQGDDPKYLKTVSTPKHFALNNSEFNRHTGTSNADEQLLFEYYLPAFEATVREGQALSVMSAYNRVNGTPASANSFLLGDVLRDRWGFRGYVVSDCDAVLDMVSGHLFSATLAEAAAAALRAGTDLNCGISYPSALPEALSLGLVTEADVNLALERVLAARYLLGEFAPAEEVAYRSIGTEVIESPTHQALALEAAERAVVLLKNEDDFLPLDAATLSSVAVIGPHGNTVTLGSYSGTPTHGTSAYLALLERLTPLGVGVGLAEGTTVTGVKDQAAFDAATALAAASDVALVFVGTSLSVLREELDRPDWLLPGAQAELIQAVQAANPRTVVVLITAGCLAVDWAEANVPAILTSFYAGQDQGTALARALFGDINPSGKLTTTWYGADSVLPPIDEYDIRQGQTYLYATTPTLYPFGHGLSYTRFAYSAATLTPAAIAADGTASIAIEVTNQGPRAGDEVVQLYVRDLVASVPRPLQALRGFGRVHLEPGESATLSFAITPSDLAFWDVTTHSWLVEPGEFELRLGSSSADIRATSRLTVIEPTSGGEGGNTGAAGMAGESAGITDPAVEDDSARAVGSGCGCYMEGGAPQVTSVGLLALLTLGFGVRRWRGSGRRGETVSRFQPLHRMNRVRYWSTSGSIPEVCRRLRLAWGRRDTRDANHAGDRRFGDRRVIGRDKADGIGTS